MDTQYSTVESYVLHGYLTITIAEHSNLNKNMSDLAKEHPKESASYFSSMTIYYLLPEIWC